MLFWPHYLTDSFYALFISPYYFMLTMSRLMSSTDEQPPSCSVWRCLQQRACLRCRRWWVCRKQRAGFSSCEEPQSCWPRPLRLLLPADRQRNGKRRKYCIKGGIWIFCSFFWSFFVFPLITTKKVLGARAWHTSGWQDLHRTRALIFLRYLIFLRT